MIVVVSVGVGVAAPAPMCLYVISGNRKSISNIMKSRGRPKVDTHPVMVRMSASLIERLDDARRNEADLPSRPEMIRRIVEEWFETKDDDA